MPRDTQPETPTTLGMTVEEMEALGKKAEAIRAATKRLAEAKERLALLKKHTIERKDYSVNTSWNPTLILKKGEGNWARDITIKIRIPFQIVQQQLVDDVTKARRELILLGGRPEE